MDSLKVRVGDINPTFNNGLNSQTEDQQGNIKLEQQYKSTGPKSIYRTLNPTTVEYVFFLRAQETFSRTDHIIGHKTNLIKFKNIEIIKSMFFDHSGMKLEINKSTHQCS